MCFGTLICLTFTLYYILYVITMIDINKDEMSSKLHHSDMIQVQGAQ